MADDNDEVQIIVPPNPLRDKVTVRMNQGVDLGPANDAVAELGVEFVARLPGDLAAIRDVYDSLCKNNSDTSARNLLFRRVHDLKGQAGTFGYKLITIVGNDLCRFLEQPVDITPRRLKVVGFHIEAMERVAQQSILDTGGEQGMKMINTLQGLTRKVLNE